MSKYELDINVTVNGGSEGTAEDAIPKGDGLTWKPGDIQGKSLGGTLANADKWIDRYAKAGSFLEKHGKQITLGALSTGVAYASKSAGYSGNYIQQTRINETIAAVGMAAGLGVAVANGNWLAVAAIGVGIGFSVWEYKENIARQNLQASYQAAYSGARMNQGRL